MVVRKTANTGKQAAIRRLGKYEIFEN